MKKIVSVALASAFALTLAACGSSDDASTEAEADTVELPADEAMDDVTAEPVADPAAMTPTPDAAETTTPDQAADQAGADAAEAAAAVAAAAAEGAEDSTQ
jgi:ABC-type uncharacterized transport system auxiliary subunit